MRHHLRFLRAARLTLLGLLFVQGQTLGQDPAKVASKNVKVVFENHRLRVLEVRVKPGEKVPMHSHPAHLTLTLSDFKGKYVGKDGETRLGEGKTSAWSWTEPITHASENVGTTEILAFAIELKEPPRRSTKAREAAETGKKK
jgi:beta-alanine degradation protein BauB